MSKFKKVRRPMSYELGNISEEESVIQSDQFQRSLFSRSQSESSRLNSTPNFKVYCEFKSGNEGYATYPEMIYDNCSQNLDFQNSHINIDDINGSYNHNVTYFDDSLNKSYMNNNCNSLSSEEIRGSCPNIHDSHSENIVASDQVFEFNDNCMKELGRNSECAIDEHPNTTWFTESGPHDDGNTCNETFNNVIMFDVIPFSTEEEADTNTILKEILPTNNAFLQQAERVILDTTDKIETVQKNAIRVTRRVSTDGNGLQNVGQLLIKDKPYLPPKPKHLTDDSTISNLLVNCSYDEKYSSEHYETEKSINAFEFVPYINNYDSSDVTRGREQTFKRVSSLPTDLQMTIRDVDSVGYFPSSDHYINSARDFRCGNKEFSQNENEHFNQCKNNNTVEINRNRLIFLEDSLSNPEPGFSDYDFEATAFSNELCVYEAKNVIFFSEDNFDSRDQKQNNKNICGDDSIKMLNRELSKSNLPTTKENPTISETQRYVKSKSSKKSKGIIRPIIKMMKSSLSKAYSAGRQSSSVSLANKSASMTNLTQVDQLTSLGTLVSGYQVWNTTSFKSRL